MSTLTFSPLVFQEPASGAQTFTVTVTRNAATAGETFSFVLRNGSFEAYYGTAIDADFVGFANNGAGRRSFSLAFAPGEEAKTFNLTIVGDVVREGNSGVEMFELSASTDGFNGTTQTQRLYIVDSDLPPSLLTFNKNVGAGAGTYFLNEGNSGSTEFVFTVNRLGSTVGTASATYKVIGGGYGAAASADDFVGGQFPTGTVTFADGQSTATIRIQVAGDTIAETDESFTVVLSNGVGAVVPSGTSTFSAMYDDDVRYYSLTPGNDIFVGTPGESAVISGGNGDDIFRNVQFEQPLTQVSGGSGYDELTITGSTSARLMIDTIEKVILEDGDYRLSLGRSSYTPMLIDARAVGAGSSVSFDASLATSLTYYGAAGNDTVTAGAGDDFLAGNGGSNILRGGSGNDTYVVASANDIIEEQEGGGYETVYASVSFALKPFANGAGNLTGAEIEVLSTQNQQGTEAINLTGNYFSQQIIGNSGNNVLNGNGGRDTLTGLRGDDTYAIADANAVIVENPGEGHDIVYTNVGYTLTGTAEVEELSFATQASTENLNIIGNAFNQNVVGNFGNNVLNGNGGIDTLIGLKGDDIYAVGNAASIVVENAGEGNDTVYTSVSYVLATGTSVEVLSTQTAAGTEAINLTGNELSQTIVGNAGANVIDGGAGADTLIGLGGSDIFRFSTALGGGNVDAITDFGNGADRLELARAVFAGLPAGALSAASFTQGATAVGGAAQIVYNQATGQLFYDADGAGAGAATLFATLAPNSVVTAEMITTV